MVLAAGDSDSPNVNQERPSGSDFVQALQWRARALRYRYVIDRSEIKAVKRILRPGDLAVDIGAHKGGYLYWFERFVGCSGRIVAFEPQAELATRLRRLAQYRRLPNIRIENLGVSDECGHLTLEIPGNGVSPSASFEDIHPDTLASRHVDVAVTTLDDYFDHAADQQIRLIKCDVEGHELKVFVGAESILRSHRPYLLFECEQRHRGASPMNVVFEYLADLGYDGSYLASGAVWPIERFSIDMQQAHPKSRSYVNNFLFVPSDRQK